MPKKKKTATAEPKFTSTRPKAFAPDPEHPHDPTKMRQVGPQEVDTEGYSGSYHRISEPKDAEAYKLKVVDEAEAAAHYGRTHHLINQENFWAGTEKEFKDQFEKN
jgi:hypothetical protein